MAEAHMGEKHRTGKQEGSWLWKADLLVHEGCCITDLVQSDAQQIQVKLMHASINAISKNIQCYVDHERMYTLLQI